MKLKYSDKSLKTGTVFQVVDKESPSYNHIFVVAGYFGLSMQVIEVTSNGQEAYVESSDIPNEDQIKVLFCSTSYPPKKIAEELWRLDCYLREAVDLSLDVCLLKIGDSEPLNISYTKTNNPLFHYVRYAISTSEDKTDDKTVLAEIRAFDLAKIELIEPHQVRHMGDPNRGYTSYAPELTDIPLTQEKACAGFEALAKYGIHLNSRFLVGQGPIMGGSVLYPSIDERLRGYIAEDSEKLAYTNSQPQIKRFHSIKEAHQAVLDIEEKIRQCM